MIDSNGISLLAAMVNAIDVHPGPRPCKFLARKSPFKTPGGLSHPPDQSCGSAPQLQLNSLCLIALFLLHVL